MADSTLQQFIAFLQSHPQQAQAPVPPLAPTFGSVAKQRLQGLEHFLGYGVQALTGDPMGAIANAAVDRMAGSTPASEMVMSPLRQLVGVPGPGESPTDPAYMNPSGQGIRPPLAWRTAMMMDSLIGGDPVAARQQFAQGNNGAGLANLFIGGPEVSAFSRLAQPTPKAVPIDPAQIISQGGGIYRGTTMGLHWFDDPVSKSTLAMPVGEVTTPEAVANHIFDKREPFVQPNDAHTLSIPPSTYLDKVGGARGVDPRTVSAVKNAFLAGEPVDPVEITFDNAGNVIGADGRHRALGAVQAGVPRIPVIMKRAVAQ